MKIKLLSIALGLSLFAVSCKKGESVEETISKNINDINVPANFNWSSTKEVSFSVGTTDSRYGNTQIQVIKIYAGDPANGGQMVASGSATYLTSFNTKVSLPTTLTDVYVVKYAPDLTTVTQKVALTTESVQVSIGTSNNVNATVKVNAIAACQRSTTDGNINLNTPEVVCYSSTNDATIDILANNGGTVKISAPNKTVTIRNFNHTGVNLVVEATTTVIVGGEIKSGETWTNYGTILLNNKLDIRGTLDNYGTTTSTNTLQINGGGTVNNYCKLYMNDFINDNILNNYSYAIASNTTRLNGGSKLNLIGNETSGVMYETKDFNKGGTLVVYGTGKTSLFKVTGTIDGNMILDARQTSNSQIITGNVQLCTPQSANIPNGFFVAPAALGCDAYVASDSCMPTGNGTAPVDNDTDKDGVANDLDAYPNDATKAFDTYTVNYANGGSTIAFEDNWPSKGDYDLNDVVLAYKFKIATSAQNKVVDITADYTLKATGGDFQNGGGIEFNIPSGTATIASTTAKLESGQSKVVVILFNNSRTQQATWNTKVGEAISPNVTYSFTLKLTDGPLISSFGGNGAQNPFIWNGTNAYGRGYETHLYGKTPTNLAVPALFNTKDDASTSTGKYYSTANKLPWAIEVPLADFVYPIERTAISDAYLQFATWAESGGTSATDWYSNTATGYRNTTKLFNR